MFGCLHRLAVDLGGVARLRTIDIRWTSDLVPGADNRVVVIGSRIVRRHVDHGQRSKRDWMDAWWHSRVAVNGRAVAVYDFTLRHSSQHSCAAAAGLGRRRLSLFGSAGPLLARGIFLGESLLLRLGLPVVVADAPPGGYYAAAELPEHGSGSDNGYLPGAV